MKKTLEKFIYKLGFARRDSTELSFRDDRESIQKIFQQMVEIKNNIDEYQNILNDATEIKHKLLKLEEYLEVEYKVEVKTNIGYSKK